MKPNENTSLIVSSQPKNRECVNTLMAMTGLLIVMGAAGSGGFASGQCFNFFVDAMKQLQCQLTGRDRRAGIIFVKRDNLPGFFNTTEVSCNYDDRNYYFDCQQNATRNICDNASSVAQPQCVLLGFETAGMIGLTVALFILSLCAIQAYRTRQDQRESIEMTTPGNV